MPVPFSTLELPFHAIYHCLRTADIHINDIDHVAYSFDPYLLIGESIEAGLPSKYLLKPSISGINKNIRARIHALPGSGFLIVFYALLIVFKAGSVIIFLIGSAIAFDIGLVILTCIFRLIKAAGGFFSG